MLSAHLRRHAALVSFLLGAGLSLSFAPFGIFPLAFVAPAVLVWLWEGATARRAAWLGFCFGSGTFLAGTYWLYTSIHVFGEAPIWIAFLLMLGLVAIMGLYHALVGYVVARFLPAAGLLRWMVGIPATWVLVEWLRGWILSGFPWLALGYSQIDSWLGAFAPVSGVYFVSLLVMLTAGALVAILRGSAMHRIVSAVVVVALWTAGALLAGREWTQRSDGDLTVSLVQGAISQDLKWQAENREATLRLYDDMTRGVLGRQLIVWPEAALPVLAHEVGDYLATLHRDARAHGSQVVMGILRYDFERQHFRNGLLVLDDPPQWYYKRRLVPFGEFFPVPAFVRSWMRLMTLPYVDFAAGDRNQPALRVAGVRLAPTICYEDAYGSEQLEVLREATVLINVSNDAWFGDSTAPHQHLEIARMRALEAGRYLLRATNNGITAIIGPDGSIVDSIPQFKAAVLNGEVAPRTGLTPYAMTGNMPVIVLCLLLLLIAVAIAARRRGRADASTPVQPAVMQRSANSKG
jgi:apolipoprotein N-acyltransferase